MLHSKCLLSTKGPLGAIWVAAYFFKKLKKDQVTATDICSCVDKILQNEMNVVTYRVLACLLIGVVRIYSKKVEYMSDECQEVLMKIRNFMVNGKRKVQDETLLAPRFSVTRPQSFELDAFDLGIDEGVSGRDMVLYEEVTPIDGAWKNKAIVQSSQDKHHCEEFVNGHDVCSTEYMSTEDVLSSVLNIAREVRALCDLGDFEGSKENSTGNIFLLEESMNGETFCGIDSEPLDPIETSIEEHQTDGEYTEGSKLPEAEKEMHENHVDPKLLGWDHRSGGEKTDDPDVAQTEKGMRQVIQEEHKLSNLLASAEKLLDDRFSEGECMDFETFFAPEEETPEKVRPLDEGNGSEQLKFASMASSESGEFQAEDDSVLIPPDSTPQSKFQNMPGAPTSELSVIPTPAAKESGRSLRKRKCVMDSAVLFSNNFVRTCIEDSSDLIFKRKKVPHSAFAAWRANCLSSHFQFSEPLIPCCSELRSLFKEMRIKTLPESAETVEPPETLDMLEPLVADRSLEQPEIAPDTPVQQMASISFGSPGSHDYYILDTPADMSESSKEEPFPTKNQDLDLSLINEENNSIEEVEQQPNGWTGRTRTVVNYLEKTFQSKRESKEEEKVNLLPLLEGKTKAESARVFYEILVLKTRGYVEVKQDEPYSDIQVSRAPQQDQTSIDAE